MMMKEKNTQEKEKQDIPCCSICGKPKQEKVIRSGMTDSNGKPIKPIVVWISSCTCEADREIAEETRKKNVQRIKELRRIYKSAGFTRRQMGMRLRHLSNNDNKKLFTKWVKEFRPRKSKGMYFYGGVGNGKTTSASCIAKELVSKGYNKVYFYTMAQYLNAMQDTYRDDSKISYETLMKKWIEADVIFIDDFGREKYTEKRLENVFQFFDRLYANCTTFFVISNPENMLKIKEIPEFEAIFDRFSETLDKVVFANSSFRKQK